MPSPNPSKSLTNVCRRDRINSFYHQQHCYNVLQPSSVTSIMDQIRFNLVYGWADWPGRVPIKGLGLYHERAILEGGESRSNNRWVLIREWAPTKVMLMKLPMSSGPTRSLASRNSTLCGTSCSVVDIVVVVVEDAEECGPGWPRPSERLGQLCTRETDADATEAEVQGSQRSLTERECDGMSVLGVENWLQRGKNVCQVFDVMLDDYYSVWRWGHVRKETDCMSSIQLTKHLGP